MNKIKQNILNILRANQKQKLVSESATERFREKSFYEQFAEVKYLSSFFAAAMPTISLITGIFFVTALLSVFVPYSIAMISAFFLIFCWELAKSKLIDLTVTLFYKGSRFAYALLVLCIGFAAVSAYTSVKGTKNAFEQMSTKVRHLEASYVAKIDSTGKHHQHLIDKADSTYKAYISAVSWRGKVDMSNKATQQVTSAYTNELSRLREDKANTMKSLRRQQEKDVQTATIESGYNLTYMIVLVVIIEVMIVLCNWFNVFFYWNVKQENDLVQTTMAGQAIILENSNINDFVRSHLMPQLSQLVAASNLNLEHGLNASDRKEVGFHNQGSKNSSKPSESQNSDAETVQMVQDVKDYLEKHKKVVEAINKGMTETQACSYANVGRSTLYNVKRIINNLHAGKVETVEKTDTCNHSNV